MKSFIAILIPLSIIIFSGCEKSNNDLNLESIIDTKQTLLKIIDNETGEITKFPEQLDKFDIVFKQHGILELPKYCNYSFGTYNLISNDSLIISNVGPGTEKYCLPDLLMDWETLFINALRESTTYSILQNHLTINCNSAYDLVFDFIESYDNEKSKILFCTNSHIINCPFEIEISLNNVVIDTLTAGSVYSYNDCQCDNSSDIGLLLNIEEGAYNYLANELNCSATNRVNSWTGEIKVVEDSCTVIFLDINE